MKKYVFFIMCGLIINSFYCGGGGNSDPAAPPTYSISGTVSGAVQAGATITLSGNSTGIATTDSSGNYSFTGIANGSYTVTPYRSGYEFTPANSAANVNGANVTGKNFTAALVTYSQADLTGTWQMRWLKTGSSNIYKRSIVTVDSSGNLTFSSCHDYSGSTTCPGGSRIWTIDSAGMISETGGDTAVHMIMTSAKNLIAGTATSGSDYELRILQKVVTGTVYSSADLQNKTFVSHSLNVSAAPEWKYSIGTSNAAGLITVTSETSPNGTTTPGALGVALVVDSNGVVTIGSGDFNGFLSDDKKTIVFTEENNLGVIQITGQIYSAGPIADGISAVHSLSYESSSASFWSHHTNTVSGGINTVSDWVCSNISIPAPTGTTTVNITSTGTITITEVPSSHGQASYDRSFNVSTRTGGVTGHINYQLAVVIKR